ncbi:BppU family phage baseplate upper protein [Clostridium perfringens]|uniref:BppU family phage baseplate upper protein n=1 Tax=Clostridium perfringens TaxID=1502 RepID=UPI0024BCD80D|nr:BppU family phage baseplate upper protein [Clostridium perfringens]
MSEIGLNINVDSYNNEGIKTIKGNNNAEIYKLYILKNKRRLSLVSKTVKLGYVIVGTKNGDVIENLNITNAEQGEITFPITNRISKQDGVYSCQLAIYGADGFLEHTATFGLTVEANIFTKIAGEIADSKDFTYLENILDKASKLSEKLKENTSTATNANSNLESNITEANNINSKLLENTSTATSLNSNLESNINLAKEVKETIKDLDTKNIEATSKIERLEGLNAKAEELSNNINEALPVKDALVKNTEEAKAANTNLLAANQEAISKNTELQASLEKTKKYISGLDGSQNIPQIRLDVDALQNGLKSNQSLAYTGSSISANDTLEGRTEGMKVKGKTMYKKKDGTYIDTWEEGVTLESFGEAEGNKISILSSGKNLLNFKSFENYIKNTHENEVLYSIKLKPNTNYTFSDKTGEWNGKGAFLILKDKDKKEVSKLIDSNVGNRKSISFTTNNNTNYYLFTYKNNIDKFNSISSNYQIEEGSQATFYEPYQSYKKDILLSAPLRENDYLYEDNGQVKVYRPAKQYTFTGDENFALHASRDDYIRFVINTLPQPVDTDKTGIISNNFPSNSDSITKETVFGYKETGIVFCILKSKLTTPDVEGFKAWLKANPTTIVYQLAIPITEIVENCVDIDLDTYQDKTYFSINNTIPGSLDFKVSSNIASIVQNTAREVNNIWDVINNLLVPSLIDINKNVALATIKNNLK